MLEDASLVDPDRQLDLPSTTSRSTVGLGTTSDSIGRPNAVALDVHPIGGSDNLVAKIPLELVTAIFASCLHEEPSEYKDQGLKKGLWTLRLVSKQWRDIVEGTPSLWKHVSIPLTVESLEQSIDMAEIWIDRAGNRPSEMHIYALGDEVWDGHLEQFKRFARIVNASSLHWTVLRLDLPTVLMEMIAGQPTNLQELIHMNSTEHGADFFDRYFLVRYSDREPPPPGHSLALANVAAAGVTSMPAPKTLCLDSIYLSSIRASWFNLNEANLQDISVKDLLKMLREAPLMTKLCLIESRRGVFPYPDWSSPVFHTSLRMFSIRVAHARYLDTLFAGIASTRLDELKLSAIYRVIDPSSFTGLMQRSSWPLTKLDLDGLHGINNDDLFRVLKSVPRLKELRIAPNRLDSNARYTVKPLFERLSRTSLRRPPQFQNIAYSFDMFLPVLESFEYVSRSPIDWHKFGKRVPDIFGIEKRLDRQSGNNFNDESRRPLKILRLVYEPCNMYYFTPPPGFGSTTKALIRQIVRYGAQIEVVLKHAEDSEQSGDSSSDTELSYTDSSTDYESESATGSENGLESGDDDDKSEDEDESEYCSELDGFISDSYMGDYGSDDDDSSLGDDDCNPVNLGFSDQIGRPVVAFLPKDMFDDVENSYYTDSEVE
ncbi:hypothetical protein JR316_0001428 [Psilocybe cubensis]|uniref:F-box domain-containing protein n=2 Tax=Psilocybe cubensis TaxID=181762 RepID=A0A8H8CR98_PSICU|nr:hypothetical protein JR316_0001428 [Psilocybe cubensis]KAH9487354.1 hypothetical protein JR316_0001428 [Psilocybe cubensis]